jgi:anthranilate phosphoribosyltransferase
VNFAIVNSLDGYDEVSLTNNTMVALNKKEIIFSPADFGMKKIQPEKLFGGNNINEAATIFTSILEGKGTVEQNNVVLANAALALQVVFPENNLTDCVEMAKESLESKKALQKLKAIIK